MGVRQTGAGAHGRREGSARLQQVGRQAPGSMRSSLCAGRHRHRQATHRTVSSYAPLSKARRWASTRRCRLRSEVTCGTRGRWRQQRQRWLARLGSPAGRQTGDWRPAVSHTRQGEQASEQPGAAAEPLHSIRTLPSTLTRRRRSRCSSASARSCCCCSAGRPSISAHTCRPGRGWAAAGANRWFETALASGQRRRHELRASRHSRASHLFVAPVKLGVAAHAGQALLLLLLFSGVLSGVLPF